jgi:hypothetical protein
MACQASSAGGYPGNQSSTTIPTELFTYPIFNANQFQGSRREIHAGSRSHYVKTVHRNLDFFRMGK